MAFASLGSIGGTSDKSNAQTISFNPSQNIAAGNIVVVWSSWIGDYFFGPNDLNNNQVACFDDAGNLYCTLWCVYPFVANICSVHVAYLDNAITTGTTLTLKFHTVNSTAKGCSAWAFSTSGSQYRWAVANYQTKIAGVIGGDPPAITISGLVSQEYLLLHNLSAVAPDTDAYTWDADYTQIDTHGTSGGAASSNMTCLGGWRIATLTTDTVDVTSDTADRDYDEALGAICEVPYNANFPSTPILDDFNRADEEPLAVPPWDGTTDKPQFGSRNVRVVSDQAAAATTGSGGGSQYYGTTFMGSNQEVWAHVPVGGQLTLFLAASGNANAATVAAMGCSSSSSNGLQYADWFVCFGEAGFTGIGVGAINPSVWAQLTNFSQVGLQLAYPVLNVWVGPGKTMTWAGALYITAGLSTTGELALAFLADLNTRVTPFGGGNTVAVVTQSRLPYLHVGP